MNPPVKKLLSNGLDADTAEFLINPNSFISGNDVRIGGSTDYGAVGYIENILKNAERFHVLPSGGINTRIGFAADDENGWIVKFNYNSAGNHGIYLYILYLDTWYDLLLDAQVTGGLNFQKNELIHSTRIENGCLYWCNAILNEPRRIDIKAAVNLNTPGTFPDVTAYVTPISQDVIYWIRRQPGLPPIAEKMTGSPFINNFIKNDGFWFCYRYIYRNYEISTLSALSLLMNYNKATDTYNFINVEIPLAEQIQQDVLQIDLVVKFTQGGKYFIINSWNKNVPADLAAIEAHNLGTPLFYDFANDVTGIALGDAYSVKPYDSLPIYVQTIEIARNRSMMANYTIGYDTPIETSLTAAAQISTDGTLTGQWVKITYNSGGNEHYFLDLGATLGFFDVFSQPSPPPYPTTWPFSNMTFVAMGPAAFAMYINSHFSGWTGGIQYPGSSATITGGPPVPGLSGEVCFKSGASYQVYGEFLDHAGRKCGIFTNTALKINNPDRSYDQVEYMTGINWSLSNANAVAEIPIWAEYVSINLTKCLTTRFFLDARGKNITYAKKDAAGAYVFDEANYASTRNGIGIDYTSLNSFGMGYTFADGDLVKVYLSGDSTVYNLSIIGQDGNWIICELKDLGTLGTAASAKTNFLFEIFTPYKPSTSEPAFEVSQIFKIDNPGTGSRSYSTLAGTITGDVTLLTRNDGSADYLTENMSPNDKFPYQWNTDAGRPNFVDDIGQVTNTNDIAYSDRLIAGTKINGLSTFDALNTKDVPLECGDITKLQVADKIEEQGNIMLAICVNETVSMYLSEAQLLSTTGNAFVAQTDDVIGTINVLQGSMGSSNPESVVPLRGQVFFFCIIKGVFVRYANNGLFPISDYGLKRVAHLFSQAYAALTQSEIEALGSRPFVFGGVDPYHLEVYWSIPTTTLTPPKGYLPSFESPDLPIIYPFDIYDGRGKVLVFKPQSDRWAAPHNYETEGFIDIRDYLFSAKDGAMFQHNYNDDTADTYSKWYNEVIKPAIGFIINEEPNIIKEFLTLSQEGNNIQPSHTIVLTEYPNLQVSDIVTWKDREGVLYSPVFRDRLSPNSTGTFDQKLYNGDVLRGQWLKVYVQYTVSSLMQIRFYNSGFIKSLGGTT